MNVKKHLFLLLMGTMHVMALTGENFSAYSDDTLNNAQDRIDAISFGKKTKELFEALKNRALDDANTN